MFNSLKQRLGIGFIRTASKILNAEKLAAWLMNGIPLSQFANYESYLQACSRKIWVSWKCLDVTAQAVQDTAYRFVNGATPDKDIKIPELEKLLKVPNEVFTFNEMRYLTTMHLKATGNAFWVKDGISILGTKPKGLYPLNPKRIQLRVDVQRGLLGYIYRANGLEIPFDVNEIIHFRRPHPNNDWYGLGDIEAGEAIFNDHINRATWGEKFWKNGAAPSTILVCEDQITDQDAWDKAKAKWQSEYGGSENSGKTAWLTGKWKKETLGMSQKDMEAIEASKWNVEQICHMHGVPLSVLGMREASNYATAKVEDMGFRRYTVKPIVTLIQDTLNTDLVTDFNPQAEIRFNISGLNNVNEVVTDYAPLFDRGCLSINDIRMVAGLPKIDGPLFDQHFILASYLPLEMAGVADQGKTDDAAKMLLARHVERALLTAPAK